MWRLMMRQRNVFFILMLLSLIMVWQRTNAQSSVQEADAKARISQLLRQLEAQPNQDSLYLDLGESYLAIEDWSGADEAFKTFLKSHSDSPRALVGRGRAYHGKGESAFIPIEAIKKLFKIDNYSKAAREYNRVLSADPNYIEAHYRIALTYLAMGGDDNYERAVLSSSAVLQQDSLYLDADYVLGLAYLHLKDYPKAETIFLTTIGKQRSVAKSMIRLSEIYTDTDQPTKAIVYFMDGVVQLRDVEVLDLLYSEYEVLLTPQERAEYRNTPLELKGTFFKKIWKSKDPTPTTERNERYEEHVRRVRYALNHYSDNIPPYYDDRGKIYVKYGEPDDRYLSPSPEGQIKPNESWTYERSIRPGLTFDFVKKGYSYRQVLSLSEAAPSGYSPRAANALGHTLYYDRSSLSESYQHLASSMDMNNSMIDFQAERSEAQISTPAEVFSFKLDGDPLTVYYTMARFQGQAAETRAEFYFAIPLQQLRFVPNGTEGIRSTLAYTMMIQDSVFNTVDTKTRRIPLLATSQDNLDGQLFLHQENFDLAPGHYRFVLRMENAEGSARCLYTNPVEVQPYSVNQLALSDIQLANQITHAESGQGRFVKHDLQVVPHPYWTVDTRYPVYLYFEGYNLTLNPVGQSQYTLTYKLKISKVDRGFVSRTLGSVGRLFSGGAKGATGSSFDRQGNSRDVVEYLAIDLGKMKSGQGDLTIQLTDKQTGKTVSQTVALQLVNPAQ